MQFGHRIVERSLDHYKTVAAVSVFVTVLIALAAAMPSLFPRAIPWLHGVEVDTDPENMLSADEPVRIFHDEMKHRMGLHDMVVVGIVREDDPKGVFTPSALRKITELTDFAAKLDGDTEFGRRYGLKPGQRVLQPDIISPSRVDTVEPLPGNAISVHWLMKTPPATQAEADKVFADAKRIPFLNGTMVSDDGKAVALYLPITEKKISYQVYRALQQKAAELGGPEQFHITGLPVAEDTFGVEMFIQMAISAPLAMAIIFVLMMVFFRKLVLVLSPMIVALMSVILTMGSLIVAGFPIHIMSSMIPIFIMPISVLDGVHIISEFFEKYQATKDRRTTIQAVMDELFTPMLYTSLTSAAGFASLALTPIPPVQVFGLFVGAGVMVAWALTVTFIPAFVMFIPARTLENFGAKFDPAHGHQDAVTRLGRFLKRLGGGTYRYAKPILVAGAVVMAVAAWGISRININDNPIKWFSPSHPIRVADRVLNRHFGGTYMAYLAMEYDEPPFDAKTFADELAGRANRRVESLRELSDAVAAKAPALASGAADAYVFFDALKAAAHPNVDRTDDERLSAWNAMDKFLDRESARYDEVMGGTDKFDPARTPALLADRLKAFRETAAVAMDRVARAAENAADAKNRSELLDRVEASWAAGMFPSLDVAHRTDETDRAAEAAASALLAEERQRDEVFKRPDVLAHMRGLAKALVDVGVVGKTNALPDIVETVNRDLHGGDPRYRVVPPTRKAVGSCITQFTSGNRPYDLDHFVTRDFRTASMWVQLTSGDNKDMQKVINAATAYLRDHHAPVELRHEWFGLTYINVIWQDKMVTGMLESFAGSFLVVLLMMIILYRSALWGLLSMIPLTVTIAAIYGAVGILGKDYDMPTAVLSSLTLGLAVDFAIHFLSRGQALYARLGSWEKTAPAVFGEPARAITRNIIIIAAGFLPLLLAPLVPYQTVGSLLATILLASGVGTLLLLPALIRVLEKRLFRARAKVMGVTCNCGTCVVSAVVLTAAVAINAYQFFAIPLTTLTWVSLASVPVLALLCGRLSRRTKCALQPPAEEVSRETPNQP